MAKVTINTRVLKKSLSRQIGPKIHQKIRANVRKKIKKQNKRLLGDFEGHVITQEIKGGPTADNISQTLGGYGNLFSFLGFRKKSDPTGRIAKFLSNSIKYKKVNFRKGSLDFTIEVSIPSMDEVEARASLPWTGGDRNWVEAIERGLSGLGSYLYDEEQDFGKKSRSGKAIQIKGSVKGWQMRPTKYMSAILKQVEKDLKRELKSNVLK